MRLDPVLLEILRHKATAAAEEMALTLLRTAQTVYIKEAADFCTAIASVNGKFFAYPEAIGVSGFLDLDCMPTIAAIGPLDEGDVILTNAPFESGALASHLPDLQLIRPYFNDGAIVAFGWCFAHTSDIGGGVPSSISPRFSEIFQEGLQIPPIKLVRRGETDEGLLRLYQANCRTPDANLGDLKAMLAAMATGARCVQKIIAAHGIANFLAAQSDLADYAAEKARAVLRRIPDGEYVFWDYLDDDFISRLPVRIRCSLRVRDGEVHADFDGTDPQLLAAYNVPTNGARHPWLMLRLMHLVTSTDKTVPLNHGLYRHLSASAPLGCLLNPRRPAAVGVRHASVIRIVDTVAGAVLQADPALLPVASGGAVIPFVLAEQDARTGTRRSIVVQALICGSGARHGADGTDGRECGMSNMQNSPSERTEDEAGVVVEEYALRPDSGGPGLWRGGTGLIFTLRILREGSALLARGLERFLFRPWGLAGGRAGTTTEVILDRGMPTETRLGKIDVLEMAKGSTLTILTPGGGGFGDPFHRPPGSVLEDLRRGYISAAAALRDYGVVIRAGEVDALATSALRARHTAFAPGFDVGPERERWEQVFDDALVTRLSRALLALPAEAAARMRQSVYYDVAPGLRTLSIPPLQAITDPIAQRAVLRARVEALENGAL